MKTYLYKDTYSNEDLYLAPIIERYARDYSLAISLIEETYEPYADITVNIDDSIMCEFDSAFVDTNNCPWAPKFIIDNKLGKPTGRYGFSGRCCYPEYKFNLKKLNKSED